MNKQHLITVCLLISLLCLTGFSSRQGTSQNGGMGLPTDYVLPLDLASAGATAWLGQVLDPSSDFDLRVTLEPRGQSMVLGWEYYGELRNVLFDQRESLGFYPTAVCEGGQLGRFYVGGTTAQGVTKIIRYEYSVPDVDTYSHTIISPALLVQAATVLEAPPSSPARDVYALLPNRGDPNSLFLEAFTTHEIYDLDLATGVAVLVAPALLVPELQYPHESVYVREHLDLGYVYVFAGFQYPANQGTPLFVDLNKDGTIDNYMVLDRAAWIAQGLSDSSRYVN